MKVDRTAKGYLMKNTVTEEETPFNVVYQVPSENDPDKVYTVSSGVCDCPDYQFKIEDNPDHKCKHIMAAEYANRTTRQFQWDSRFCDEVDRVWAEWRETA